MVATVRIGGGKKYGITAERLFGRRGGCTGGRSPLPFSDGKLKEEGIELPGKLFFIPRKTAVYNKGLERSTEPARGSPSNQ